jgi:transcriptional regulator with XRE-family HTH domain
MKNNLHELRLRRGLSLAEVAKAAGTSRSQVQKLESGERRLTLAWIIRLAKSLDVSLIELLPKEHQGKSDNDFDREIAGVISLLDVRDKKVLFDVASSFLKKKFDTSS